MHIMHFQNRIYIDCNGTLQICINRNEARLFKSILTWLLMCSIKKLELFDTSFAGFASDIKVILFTSPFVFKALIGLNVAVEPCCVLV